MLFPHLRLITSHLEGCGSGRGQDRCVTSLTFTFTHTFLIMCVSFSVLTAVIGSQPWIFLLGAGLPPPVLDLDAADANT